MTTLLYRRSDEVTIRWATPDDATALHRLAQLDTAEVPEAPVLLGLVGGELWAATSLRTGAVIADPFRRSAEVADLLRERGRHLTVHDPARRSARWLDRLGDRLGALAHS